MKFQSHISSSGRATSGGFTLVELVMAMAIGLVVIGSVVSLSLISAQNFVATSNYATMDNQSRNALDRISREIRNATSLAAISTNNPQFLRLTNVNNSSGTTITHYAGTNILTLTSFKSGQTQVQTLLTGCTNFSFQLFDRYPNPTNFTFFASTNAVTGKVDLRFCKVINMSWKCSRVIVGSKLSTEIVQTAQVVLRNQVSE